MSVIVKGMEMPENCRECRFQDFGSTTGDTWCGVKDIVLAKNFEVIGFDGKPDWCPLVALPDKHGDLIDRNGLLRDIEHYHLSDGKFQHWVEVQNTIVEAEGEE